MAKHCRRMWTVAATLGTALAAGAAGATCTVEPYLGSMCITAATFCPKGYADARGQVLPIAGNTALFSLLGTTYGGDGRSTFALPDLQGRVPRGIGTGVGLTPVEQGEVDGQEAVILGVNQMPAHTHSAQIRGTDARGNTDAPGGAVPAQSRRSSSYSTGAADAAMGASAVAIGVSGGGQPVDVVNPYVGLRYCIAVEGIFPPRD